jgi:hypothetical protein
MLKQHAKWQVSIASALPNETLDDTRMTTFS